jgi:hypothetical protein
MDEDEKGSLERILGIVVVTEDAAANAQHHRTMPAHERFKSRFFASANVALQQLSVAQARPIRQNGGSAKLIDDRADGSRVHVVTPSPAFMPSTYSFLATGILIHLFPGRDQNLFGEYPNLWRDHASCMVKREFPAAS